MAEEKAEINKPQAPKKKSNTVKIVIIVAAVLILICLLLSIIGGLGIFVFVKSASKPVKPIKQHLEALNQGKINEAYEKYTSEAFKNATSFENFKDIVKSNPQIFKSKSSSFNNVKINSKQAKVKGTITGKDGTVTPMTYDLIRENNKWLILGFRKSTTE